MLKIFLVDDSNLVRRRLMALLEILPDVLIVGEAEELDAALRGISTSGAELAVVDLHLPGSNGMRIVELLARATPPVPTMVLTNHSGAAMRAACDKAGARFFFDKTCEYELACETIGRLAKKPPAAKQRELAR